MFFLSERSGEGMRRRAGAGKRGGGKKRRGQGERGMV